MPPAPIADRISYGPSLVPVGSGKKERGDYVTAPARLALHQDHLQLRFLRRVARLGAGAPKPPLDLLQRNRMAHRSGDFARVDVEHGAGRHLLGPWILAETANREHDRLVEAFGLDLDGVPDAARVLEADCAGADRHGTNSNVFVFCSLHIAGRRLGRDGGSGASLATLTWRRFHVTRTLGLALMVAMAAACSDRPRTTTDGPAATTVSPAPQPTCTSGSDVMTLTGCVRDDMTLVSGGSSYKLEGKADLTQHTGHQMRVMGRAVGDSSDTSSRRLSVESFEMI